MAVLRFARSPVRSNAARGKTSTAASTKTIAVASKADLRQVNTSDVWVHVSWQAEGLFEDLRRDLTDICLYKKAKS